MNSDQIQEIKKTIVDTIEKSVNGKIIKLTKDFEKHQEIVNQYIIDDNEWKAKAEPVITMGKNVQGFGKVSLYIVGFVASVAGAIMLLLNLFRKD